MKFYEKPQLIVIAFNDKDILTYSGETQGTDVGGGDDWHKDIFDDLFGKSF